MTDNTPTKALGQAIRFCREHKLPICDIHTEDTPEGDYYIRIKSKPLAQLDKPTTTYLCGTNWEPTDLLSDMKKFYNPAVDDLFDSL